MSTCSWPAASWYLFFPLLILFFSLSFFAVIWPHMCMLRKNTYEAVHQTLWWLYLQEGLSRYLLVTPKWNPHQHQAGSILYFDVVSCPVNACCWPAYERYKKKSVQVFGSHGYARTGEHTHISQWFRLSEQCEQECGPNWIRLTEQDLSFLIIEPVFMPQTWN